MYEYAIKEVVKVVDGDTIDVVIDLGFDLTKKERIRLAGIDTPESRTRDLEEKAMGLEAKEHLKHKIESSENLRVKTEKDGKYGRMLGWLYDGESNINKEMVTNGYAWEYDGGTKIKSLEALKAIREKEAT
jgi:micrococcal nuclease|tara:strand:- start:177 stop:569 length:393 start_codon:yes stop_codon:yes gene_type:complete